MEIPKFKCQKCGNCCKTWEDLCEIPSFIGDNIIILNKPKILINSWDRQFFPKEIIVPQNILFDITSDKIIALNYTFNLEVCPNLSQNNVCKIYDNRPLVCKSFPCPIEQELEKHKLILTTFGKGCKAEMDQASLFKKLGINEVSKGSELFSKLYKRYGEAYIWREIENGLAFVLAKGINILFEDGFRFAKKGYDMKFLIKRINNAIEKGNIIDLFEYINKTNKTDLKDLFSENGFNNMKKMIDKEYKIN
jgi:Fe-S-cluster containining protein